jgi:hypothetical protein
LLKDHALLKEQGKPHQDSSNSHTSSSKIPPSADPSDLSDPSNKKK